MGERDELIKQGVAEVQRQGWASSPSTDAVRSLVDACWRPPHYRPHASRCQLDTDDEGDCTWPEPSPAEPLFEGRIEGLDWFDPLDTDDEDERRTRPAVIVASKDRAPSPHPLIDRTGVEVAVYRKGDVPGPARPKSDAERLRDFIRQATSLEMSPSVDACEELLAAGLPLPEPKVRWTVDEVTSGIARLLDDGSGVLTAATEAGRQLLPRLARLLNEEGERHG